jgi:hypothetical protein
VCRSVVRDPLSLQVELAQCRLAVKRLHLKVALL